MVVLFRLYIPSHRVGRRIFAHLNHFRNILLRWGALGIQGCLYSQLGGLRYNHYNATLRIVCRANVFEDRLFCRIFLCLLRYMFWKYLKILSFLSALLRMLHFSCGKLSDVCRFCRKLTIFRSSRTVCLTLESLS